MVILYKLLERRHFSNLLFFNRNNRTIYPLEFFTKLFRYHKNKNISLDKIEENIGVSIIEYYFVISEKWKNTINIKRLTSEFVILINGLFREMNIFESVKYIEYTKTLLMEIHYSMRNIEDWLAMIKIWYLQVLIQSKFVMKILLIQQILDMILSYDTRIADIREDMNIKKIIDSGKENVILLLNNIGEMKEVLCYFCNNVINVRNVPSLIRAIFYTKNPISLRIRNYFILKYYCQERSKNVSFHNITNFIRRRIMYDGDFELYQSIHILMLGLQRGVKIWNMKRRLKYMNTRIQIIKELKSLPPMKHFPGGEDYKKAINTFHNNSIN
jgi:hypothetical protein